MATKVQSYGSRRFAACDCWTQTSVAGNAAKQRLLIAISHGVKRNIRCENWKEILLPTSFTWCEKKHCCQRSAFLGLLQQRGSFSLWCSKGKALCERLFAFVSPAAWYGQPKCRLCLPWKNFCGRPCLCYLCLQSNICFVLFYITIFCVIRVPFVPASRLACHWMCDSPRTGYAQRLTTIFMWREQTKT